MTAALAAAGYRADVAALRRRRREHEAAADPASPAAAAEVLTLRHREAMLTGARPEDLLALADQVDDALARFPTWPDLRLLRAGLALAVHRPDQARTVIDALPGLADLPPGRVLVADLAQFAGDYRAAREGYLRAAQEDPQWDTSARLAALAAATGDVAEADTRYDEAEDDLTVKQLRAFAWVRVQRGTSRSAGATSRAPPGGTPRPTAPIPAGGTSPRGGPGLPRPTSGPTTRSPPTGRC